MIHCSLRLTSETFHRNTHLPLFELTLKELSIVGPRLAIRRDRSGVLRIAGIEIDPEEVTGDLPLTDWILRQRQIVIRDALILWDDDLRNAPQLVLDRVQVRLENRFGHHRFGLKGTPPAELAWSLVVDAMRSISSASWRETRPMSPSALPAASDSFVPSTTPCVLFSMAATASCVSV